MVRGKLLTANMKAHYINKNHPISDSPLVDTVMLYYAVSYDPTLRHVDLIGKVNDKGVYHHFLTGNNLSTLQCYQFFKKDKTRYEYNVKTGCFWYKRLYNPFTQNIGLEAQFERSYGESDTKDDRTKNTNIKEGGNYGNGQVANPDVETVDLTGDD